MKGSVGMHYRCATLETDWLTVEQISGGLRFIGRTPEKTTEVHLNHEQLMALRKQITRALKGLPPL